jgi:hypothetical protein
MVACLLRDTITWAVPGAVLVFAAIQARSGERFFRRRIRDAVGLAVLVEL